MKYWIEGWKKCMVFSGRSSRKEFWMFFLWNLLIGFCTAFWVYIGFAIIFTRLDSTEVIASAVISIVLYYLVTLLPFISSAVRRLHDIGKDGWNVLIPFIPVIGLVVLFVWMGQSGDEAANAYGPPC